MGDAEIIKTMDIGDMNKTHFVKTHIANKIEGGDTVLAYDIENGNFNETDYKKYKESKLPKVIVVQKHYKKKKRNRKWKLKRLEKEVVETKRPKKDTAKREEEEAFLEDLEEDEELRSKINIFKDKRAIASELKNSNKDNNNKEEGDEDDDDEEDQPDIDESELLEDFDDETEPDTNTKKD